MPRNSARGSALPPNVNSMLQETRTPRDEEELRAIWGMLCRAFGWNVADFDRFASGGPLERVLAVFVDGEPVAVSRIREFGQFFGGRRVPMGGFSPVGVAAEYRGRGFGSLVTAGQFPLMRERGEVLSGLYPATNALYRRVGFELAGVWSVHKTRSRELQRLPVGRDTPTRRASEADHAAIERCYARVARNLAGFLDRNRNWWDRIFGTDRQQIYVVDASRRAAAGDIAGYVRYTLRWPERASVASIDVAELIADEPSVAHALWRLVGSSSSIAPDCTIVGPPEEPLLLSLPEQDLVTSNEWRWMARIIDAPGAVAARGYAPGSKSTVSLRIVDPQCDWNDGRWRLVVDGDDAFLERGGDGELELGIGALSALYTGYASPWQLVTAGLVRGGTPRALAELAGAFAGPAPWMPDFY
jgi:predicted acetyltransferase